MNTAKSNVLFYIYTSNPRYCYTQENEVSKLKRKGQNTTKQTLQQKIKESCHVALFTRICIFIKKLKIILKKTWVRYATHCYNVNPPMFVIVLVIVKHQC